MGTATRQFGIIADAVCLYRLAVGVVITVPSVYYILSSIETGGHHAEGHGEEHHAEGEKEDESESKDEPEVKEAEGKSEGSEDKAETKDSEEKEEPKDSGDEKPADDKKEDKPDAQKEPVKGGTSGKQEGISNADTHHSTDTHDGSKSTKGEGVAETAKLKGTVQADRPGAESEQKGKANQDKSK
ncbi:uncharacterized protein BDZ99DRAFT_477482 [Mytilinidion resinicola]|uniref:Uncharacterized protein n=1 Tax=Mytilinidion resinicola TaxID=574789 RepID=A0A6A6YMA3_9PEZI|nr:uncharacterized protein BDZ99DRAFT_477482 [Mytilinidion resinicola]KAF2808997.1 hypothetical protein BDZ99DRAFT_477482 [Mytilinidion resinicola]